MTGTTRSPMAPESGWDQQANRTFCCRSFTAPQPACSRRTRKFPPGRIHNGGGRRKEGIGMFGQLKQGLMAVGIAAALALGTAQATSAATSGTTGPASIPPPACVVTGVRYLYQVLPTVYAANRTPGAGNDRQIVRYWSRVYDYASGNPLTDWIYGGGGYANDNLAAALPSNGTVHGTPYATYWTVTGNQVREQYLIGWYTTGDTLIGSWSTELATYTVWQWDGGSQMSSAC
jgi:hypothetical protein